MDLQELRKKIDEIDNCLVNLYQQRMDIAVDIARHKKQNNMPVYDPVREREVLAKVACRVPEERKSSIAALYLLIFELSRAEQEKI
jgi:monofunctional chorismate mutase